MKVRAFFIVAILGILAGIISVVVYRVQPELEPLLAVNYNPYDNGIYASGIIESFQNSGSNINIYPEVTGTVMRIFVHDGQKVKQGEPVLAIDDSVQRAIVAKDAAQALAAQALLEELKAEPRKEKLDVALAQLDYAQANLKNAQMQLEKLQKSHKLNSKSISKNALDNAINTMKIAKANLQVAKTQYDLVKVGAWNYEIINQENQYQAALQAYRSDQAVLDSYMIKSPVNGVILRVAAAVGGYVSPQGIYDSSTQKMLPVVTMGGDGPYLAVRCYVNEMLVPKLPKPGLMEAKMMIRGESNYAVPLEFIRVQPYTIPNIALSNETVARVDVRVLPIIFKFKKPDDISLYTGQLVDVYIRGKKIEKKA